MPKQLHIYAHCCSVFFLWLSCILTIVCFFSPLSRSMGWRDVMLLPCSLLPASRRTSIRSNRNLAVCLWVTLWICVSLFLLVFHKASINSGSSFFSPHPRAWLRILSCQVLWWILMSSAVSNRRLSLMLWPRQNSPPSPSTSSVSFPTSHYFHYHPGWFNENYYVI